MSFKIKEGLTFDDLLLVPQYSTISSRSKDVSLYVELSKTIKLDIPIMPANMATLVNEQVAEEFIKLGGMCFLHRFNSFEDQIKILKSLKEKYNNAFEYVGVSVGVKPGDYNNIKTFNDLGVKIVCIDVAHGDNDNCFTMTKYISEAFPDMFLVSGNVATANGAMRLWDCGADAVKCNIGAGSICSTRIETGHGVPQATALMDIAEAREKHFPSKFIIADGGCNKVGDLVKSLALADVVMTGNMFAGAEETPGEIFEIEGVGYKNYNGSSTHKDKHIEGVKALVKAKGKIKDIIDVMKQGITSGCSYSGARNLKQLKENAEFIKITNAGLKESHAHDVLVVK